MAGLLARGSLHVPAFPAHRPVACRSVLAAYSCGGSRGFGASRLTMFPFHPDPCGPGNHHPFTVLRSRLFGNGLRQQEAVESEAHAAWLSQLGNGSGRSRQRPGMKSFSLTGHVSSAVRILAAPAPLMTSEYVMLLHSSIQNRYIITDGRRVARNCLEHKGTADAWTQPAVGSRCADALRQADGSLRTAWTPSPGRAPLAAANLSRAG
jgi:hypothetical protein